MNIILTTNKGHSNFLSNYGWLFTADGVAGILGPQLAGLFKDSAQNSSDPQIWMAPFIIAGVACLIGSLIMIFTKPIITPDQKQVKKK